MKAQGFHDAIFVSRLVVSMSRYPVSSRFNNGVSKRISVPELFIIVFDVCNSTHPFPTKWALKQK